MPTFYFQLGNTPQLSLAELDQLLPVTPQAVGHNLAQAELDKDFSASKLQKKAGGIVKSLKKLKTINNHSLPDLKKTVIDSLLNQQTDNDKLTFSIFYPNQTFRPQLNLAELKKQLRTQVSNVRYVRSQAAGLSAAVLLHQPVTELALIEFDDELVLAKTVSIQDIDDWTKRDRNKPFSDHERGMLPPKVARMMVNLAHGYLPDQISQPNQAPTLYDPFCGSGTILMEAMMRNFAVQGSDIAQEVVTGAEKNLNWLKKEYQLTTSTAILQRDATRSFNPQTKPWAQTIVTEPFLGKQTPKNNELPDIFKGLYRTYLGTMKNWRKILKPTAPVIVITPIVHGKNKTYRLQRLIDNWPQLGYTTISQPIEYSRSQARVRRQINFLRYQP